MPDLQHCYIAAYHHHQVSLDPRSLWPGIVMAYIVPLTAWPSESSAEASNVGVNGVQKNHEQCPLKSFTI